MTPRNDWAARERFIPNLGIVDDYGKHHRLNNLWPEQEAMLEALHHHNRIYVLKCRQVGLTTITTAFNFWKAYTSPDPRSFLCIAHEEGSQLRVNGMLKHYYNSLPGSVKCTLPKANTREIVLGHNGATFRQMVAGGRGQAKSYTYTDVHATEGGYWPTSSAATKGGNTDRVVWGSTMSTVHAPDAHIVWESTADGPFGLNFELYKRAVNVDSDWHFLFFPWQNVSRYQRPVPDPEAFADTLTNEEVGLIHTYDLTFEQLAFRRHKMEEDRMSLLQFRKEYPFHHLEPFLSTGVGWFDQEMLLQLGAAIPTKQVNDDRDLQVYVPYEKHHKYAIGQDTSGGVRKDYGVIQVLRDDLVQCAKWRSNRHSPRQQAEQAAKMSAMYGKAPILTEMNNHGKSVVHRLEEMGAKLWTNREGKYFYSLGGRAGNSKRELYDWARYLINGGFTVFHSSNTLLEAGKIIEKPNGKIECSGESDDDHDDDIDGWALAAWCAKRYWRKGAKVGSKSRFAVLQSRTADPFNLRRK